MSTIDYIIQSDFTGGENTLVQPEFIAENEVAELLNMVPRYTDSGIESRAGIGLLCNVGSLDILSVFTKVDTSGNTYLVWVVNNSDTIEYYIADISSHTVTRRTAAQVLESAGSSVLSRPGGHIGWVEEAFTDSEFSLSIPVPSGGNTVRLYSSAIGNLDAGSFEVSEITVVNNEDTYSLIGEYDVGDIVDITTSAEATLRLLITPTAPPNTVATAGAITGVDVFETITPTEILSVVNGGTNIWWADWDANKFIFSDESTGLYVYEIGDNVATIIKDKSDPVEPNAPAGKFLMQHKGRLFMATGSTVHVCGSDDSVNPRYESWSGLTASSGGSIDVTPYGDDITGLASAFGGVLVFKRNSMHLWSYSDGAAPWDAVSGGQVDVIHASVGCIGHRTIAYTENGVMFIGSEANSKYGLYESNGSSIVELSEKVPRKMYALAAEAPESLSAETFDSQYLLFDNGSQGGLGGLTGAFDKRSMAWSSSSSTRTTDTHTNARLDFIYIGGEDGNIFVYPSGHNDVGNTGITIALSTRRYLNGDQLSDLYFRMLRLSGGGSVPTTLYTEIAGENGEKFVLSNSGVEVYSPSSDVWDDSDGTVWLAEPTDYWNNSFPIGEAVEEIGYRSRGGQLRITGTAFDKFWLDYIAVGVRSRRDRNYSNA